ncbi:MAG: Trm112 family protein [Thermodesulfovibrionaceae bacterium]
MKRVINDILICPICLPVELSLRLIIDEIEGDDIFMGSLVCNRCGAKYRIEDGIAILTRNPEWQPDKTNKYENPQVVSSYI